MKSRMLLFSVLIVFLVAGNAFALGTNITVWDNVGVNYEDNEVEPNCVPGQIWDLEGFFLDGNILTMVGGFDFKDGVNYGGNHYGSGDIFIDTNADAIWGVDIENAGNGITEILNDDYHFDYAIDLVFDPTGGYHYDVYALDSDTLLSVFYGQNGESNPWQLKSTEGLNAIATGEISWAPGLSDSVVGGLTLWDGDGTHYSVGGIDLSFLGADIDNFLAKFTYECGNDNLIGSIPDATTLVLLGSAMVGVGVFGRNKVFKRS